MATEKVLIVDDEVNICELLRLYLEKEGYITEVVNDGSKAVEAFNSFNPDMVLLWRPHPTLKATIKSMRKDCYDRYVSLEEKFIKEKIGIYDTTPDMYLSITISDAYYGDWSSLVELYRQTGKPIMIQNTAVLGD